MEEFKMKTRSAILTANKEHKFVIIKELEFILGKMDQAKNPDEKIYFFSAVQALFNRILNLDYTENLLIAFHATNDAYIAFQQRFAANKQGDIGAMLTENHLTKLSEITKELLKQIVDDENIDSVLRKFLVLGYSATGNGYYLMQKGILKI
jgi:hypothetical protein